MNTLRSGADLCPAGREVEQAGEGANRAATARFRARRIRSTPPRTRLRRAIVNGLFHRDWPWGRDRPSIEHLERYVIPCIPRRGIRWRVTPANINHAPAVPPVSNLSEGDGRASLANAREGSRNGGDMLAIGRPAQVIAEVDGPYVRVVLSPARRTRCPSLVAALTRDHRREMWNSLSAPQKHLTRMVGRRGVHDRLLPAILAEEANEERRAGGRWDAAGSAR